jgi:hypothetical protein
LIKSQKTEWELNNGRNLLVFERMGAILPHDMASLSQTRRGRFAVYSRETGLDRSAENHYPVQSIADICALPVASISACLGKRQDRHGLVESKQARTLAYREHAVTYRRPHPVRNGASVIEAPAAGHSVKPDKVLGMIEHYFPNLPKIELHTDAAWRGWDGMHGARKRSPDPWPMPLTHRSRDDRDKGMRSHEMQTGRESFIEAVTNTVIGCLLGFAIAFAVMKLDSSGLGVGLDSRPDGAGFRRPAICDSAVIR